jgi:hypothetical protein
MTMIDVKVLGPGEGNAFPELRAEDVKTFADCDRAIVMHGGTEQGKSAVQLLATAEDGKTVIIQLTAALLDMIQGVSIGARKRWGELPR